MLHINASLLVLFFFVRQITSFSHWIKLLISTSFWLFRMAHSNGWSNSVKKCHRSSVFHNVNSRSVFGTDVVQPFLINSSKGMYTEVNFFFFSIEQWNHLFETLNINILNLSVYEKDCGLRFETWFIYKSFRKSKKTNPVEYIDWPKFNLKLLSNSKCLTKVCVLI